MCWLQLCGKTRNGPKGSRGVGGAGGTVGEQEVKGVSALGVELSGFGSENGENILVRDNLAYRPRSRGCSVDNASEGIVKVRLRKVGCG